jgi:hypothetical protein
VLPTTIGSGPTALPLASGELIRGVAYDSADRPLDGARVEVLDGPQAGTSTISNRAGEFSLTGTFDDTTRFRATREGHVTADLTLRPACAVCNPARWIYFYLDLLVPPVTLAGDYTLTVLANSACANLPSGMRTRTYAATVAPGGGWSGDRPQDRPANTVFSVTVSGASFRDDLLPYRDAFAIRVAGDYVALWLGDHGRPGLVEQPAPYTYLALSGEGAASVGAAVSGFSVPFGGFLDYCAMGSEMRSSSYECVPGPGVVHTRCDSAHLLVFTRR